MRVNKIINNNIISAFDEKGREIVVMGKGLGFGLKSGALIDASKIDKIFRMDSKNEIKRLQDLLLDVPIERVQIVNNIISMARGRIKDKIQRSIYITLIDHINFAIERQNNNIEFHNPLSNDIRRFYPTEYQIGQEAVVYINKKLQVALPNDEAASIALHFINAELGREMQETIDITKIIQNCIKIVKYQYHIEINEGTLDYERFISHLKYFAVRFKKNENYENVDEALNQMIRSQYGAAYKCAEKIADFVKREYQKDITLDDITYLTVHIVRITNKRVCNKE